MTPQRYICLDRDGTIIKLIPHLTSVLDAVFLPGVIEGSRLLKSAGYGFGIFTNQSVIGRGLCAWNEVIEINNFVIEEFRRNQIMVDFCYVCPHTPDDMCKCRKPNLGMGVEAIVEFNIDCKNSYMIGDNQTDIEFGMKLGMKTVHLSQTNYNIATITCNDFYSAAELIASQGDANVPKNS